MLVDKTEGDGKSERRRAGGENRERNVDGGKVKRKVLPEEWMDGGIGRRERTLGRARC